jgi:hypothetical protein
LRVRFEPFQWFAERFTIHAPTPSPRRLPAEASVGAVDTSEKQYHPSGALARNCRFSTIEPQPSDNLSR